MLSKAGRLVLIKSVLNSMPLYFMSLFQVPRSVVKQIIRIQREFFWKGLGDRRGLPLVKWEVIQKPRRLGGLGVDDITIKNAALLFKWWWRFSEEGNTLWKKIICSIHRLEANIPLVQQQRNAAQRGLWDKIMKMDKWGG